MTSRRTALPAGALVALLLLITACSGRSINAPAASSGVDLLHLPATSAPATANVATITWALYRDVSSLDPATAFDYPENTVVATLCDSLLRQQPDGSITPGLAHLAYRTPTTIVLTLRSDVRFWDGSPLTPADVVFSLKRNTDPQVGGLYFDVFDQVRTVAQTGAHQVTISLKQPDYGLAGELSAMPGVVIEKRFALAKGHKYGTPGGGVMCTGPFELGKWVPGQVLQVTRNPHYWDPSLRAMAGEIDFEGVSDAAALTSGLSTGAIDGTYLTDTSNLTQLRRTPNLNVDLGPSLEADYFIPSNLKGPLGDVRVRQALSLAFDRKSYISAVYDGDATIPRLPTSPGTWGFAKRTFSNAWNATPPLTQNLAKARALIKAAGAAGEKIVIGTSSGLDSVNTEADAWQAAADSIGLKATLYNVSAENYINFFTDAGARKHVDAFSTTTYGDFADPAALDETYALKGGVQNYSGYQNPTLTALFNRVRSDADPVQRATDEIAAERLILKQLPWIPVDDPASILVLNKRLTGAPTSFAYMQAPWLARTGAAG